MAALLIFSDEAKSLEWQSYVIMSMSEVLKMNAKSLSVKGFPESEYILCHCTSQNLWTLLFTEKSFS